MAIRKLFLFLFSLCHELHIFGHFRKYFMSRKSNVVVRQENNFLVKPFSLLSHTTYVTSANMAVTLAQFLWFLQNKGKWIKRGKNHYRHEQTESHFC